MIFKFHFESHSGRTATLSLMQDATDVCRHWHKSQQVLPEQLFAFLSIAFRKNVTGGGEFQGTGAELGELQNVQSLGDWKKIIRCQRQRPC